MSNFLAIATVTAVLQRTLQSTIQEDVEGARVTTLRPASIGHGTPASGVNLYLYQTALNSTWNNADNPGRNRKGVMAKRSRTALDLHYMISFYGNEVELEPQRLMGSVVRTLNDHHSITESMIREMASDSNFHYLVDSDLYQQVEAIQFLPMDLSLDDLSKVWSTFFQTQYALSMAYRGTVIIIEGEESAKRALPVRERMFGVAPLPSQPFIKDVINVTGRYEPILTNSTLLIRGQLFQGQQPIIRIGTVDVPPTTIGAQEMTLSLESVPASALRAGVQSLQVVQRQHTPAILVTASSGRSTRQPSSHPPILPVGMESNAAAFILRPSIQQVDVVEIEGDGDDMNSAIVVVLVDCVVMPEQRILILMNEWKVQDPTIQMFKGEFVTEPTQTLRFPVQRVKSGTYLVRIQVDGAESPLEVDRDRLSETSGWYIAPRIDIP